MALLQPITADDGFFVGENKTLNFHIYKADGVTLENITGWTIKWELYENFDSAAAVLTKTATVSDGPNGLATSAIVPADTSGLEPKTYKHALWRTDTGNKTVLLHGPADLLGAPVPA